MKLKLTHIAPLTILCLLMLAGIAMTAQKQLLVFKSSDKPEVKVNLFGSVKREGQDVDLQIAGKVVPGETLDWVITSENVGTGAANNYKVIGQIPKGTSLIPESAHTETGATIVYSIDNGKVFSAQPKIEEKQPDGSIKQVPAPVSMYTQIRYEWNDALISGNKVAASYKVLVK
jgi:uncharacterized repeat protein (TIGR01451 family)